MYLISYVTDKLSILNPKRNVRNNSITNGFRLLQDFPFLAKFKMAAKIKIIKRP